jgi:NTP pyrophosphatase (non-canonical NTP hydrolase)
VLWYIANLAVELGLDMDGIARKNIAKLKSRKERGVLHGSGDNR